MKTGKILTYLAIIVLGVLLAQCSKEGPIGPAGADGLNGDDGVDGSTTCMQCHSDLSIQVIADQFRTSGHFAGEAAVSYAGGRASCAECHSHEGFVEFAETGTVANDFMSPSAWKCGTCHSIHDTYTASDYALRLSDPVTMADATVVDMGTGNLCINCHQTRRTGPYDMVGEFVDANGVDDDGPGGVGDHNEYEMQADEFFISSSHYGPHHGPQGNLMHGSGFAEIAGSTSYPTAGGSSHMSQVGECNGCHMATADYDEDAGGHSFIPTMAVCNDCHSGSDVTVDFNYDGLQTEVQGLIDQLDVLLVAQGVVTDGHPNVGVYSVAQSQAFYNYIGIVEDRSVGVHNPGYIKALLNNSIEAITP